ncbi:MAG: sulfite exporter TauE/SafE family protein [Desulfobacterales bacterium]|nr:sulfite exporter TauE/SafE family protein [Desulfobacterales bacterium]
MVNPIYYLTAMFLGAMHALEPGHGKTVVAAYLIGSKGKKIDAVILGVIVTFTHTFSIILLAIAVKLTSNRITLTEESLHGYLGTVAGLMIFSIGMWMLVQRIRGREPFHFHSHDASHAHIQPHQHSPDKNHDHDHQHAHDSDNHTHGGKRASYWQLCLLGISGGIVPCPAAIAILLASVAGGRMEEGLTYVLLFSLGLAAVLIAIGLVVVGAGKLTSRFLDAKKFARKISIVSAALITLIGGATIIGSIGHLI